MGRDGTNRTYCLKPSPIQIITVDSGFTPDLAIAGVTGLVYVNLTANQAFHPAPKVSILFYWAIIALLLYRARIENNRAALDLERE